MELIIRAESSSDIDAVRAVETAAFSRSDEANLVDQIRENGGVTLSLVAEQAGEIVGHSLFSLVTVGSATAVGLGPVAVMPDLQKQGIGTALIRDGLERCRAMGHELVFLVGHPSYYPRFGFQPALPLGFDCDYVTDKNDHAHFMVIELVPGALADYVGYVRYRPEFDGV